MKTELAPRKQRRRLECRFLLIWLAGIIFVAGSPSSDGGSFTDDFSAGFNPAYWRVSTSSSRFSVEATNGLLIQSTAGTTTGAVVGGELSSTLTAYGNFDVSIDFTNANLEWLTGATGNQAQLNCYFGNFGTAVNFLMVRSDEANWAQNAHVWVGGGGGSKLGAVYSASNSYGTLRITRTNSLVSGYLNSTLIAQTNEVATPAKFQIVLQNNHTADAVSITYQNFSLSADQIGVGPTLGIQFLPTNSVVVSWPTWGVSWTTNYSLESISALDGTGTWQTVTNVPSTNDGNLVVTNAIQATSSFYRLIQQ